MITVNRLAVSRGKRRIISDVSFSVSDGEVVGVVGVNGCGKSTLLMALHNALKPDTGEVLVDGKNIAELSRREIAKQIAVVAQERDAVLPLTVRDAVGLGRLASRHLIGYGDDADQSLVDEAMARVELTDLADRLVTNLSGGERQRVMIARAIAQESPHLLMDEPTNHLDLRHQFALLDLISELGRTTVIVLHDLNLAARCCGQIILLDGGKVAARGTPTQVFTPQILEPIYGLKVRTVESGGRVNLLFDNRP
ncbi:ABC transporter ATP-binding protein [Propionimicrobium lymphophilum]|uniref:ABC transporter ATP-binding protein n=1 Tax=Propionimicrobium lymphophilum TaxID=33012 RepID=UPI0023F05F67|nr:ABC transporter ATP-binding protein [Propionimicrobium lymphophilum]